MTARPYELLARFAANGTVAGVSVRTIDTINGRDYESDPQPLSGASDPAFAAFAQSFAAAVVAQRDQLLVDKSSLESQLATITAERDSLQAEVTRTSDRDQLASDLATVTSDRDAKAAQILELESQLDALLNPPVNPRHVAPFDFLARLTPEEIYILETSADPQVIVGRAKLHSIISFIDLDNPETIGLVQYMEQAGLIQPGRAAEILT